MIDIHNHTIYSDGEHKPETLVINALDLGINTLGFSDHHRAFFMEKPKYKSIEVFLREIERLKDKYRDKIELLAGLELNVNFKDEKEEERIPFEYLDNLDYVLIERIEGLAAFEGSLKHLVRFKDIGRIIEKINTKVGLAHTDLLELGRIYGGKKGIEYGLDYVLSTMKECEIFWEMNTQPQYGYFDYIIENMGSVEVNMLFDRLRKYNIEIFTGTDTHFIPFDKDINRLKKADDIVKKIYMEGDYE